MRFSSDRVRPRKKYCHNDQESWNWTTQKSYTLQDSIWLRVGRNLTKVRLVATATCQHWRLIATHLQEKVRDGQGECHRKFQRYCKEAREQAFASFARSEFIVFYNVWQHTVRSQVKNSDANAYHAADEDRQSFTLYPSYAQHCQAEHRPTTEDHLSLAK
jgi:hypothetical protein